MTRATIMSAGAAAAWDSERPAGAAACAHMKARMIANPTRVYRLVTVTPRLISAMMPSDEALLDENSVALMGIAFPPRNCHPAHHRVHAQHKKSFRIRCKKLGAALMEHAPRGTGTPVFDRK